MECNVGTVDRAVRIVFGLVVIVAVFLLGMINTLIGSLLVFVGIVFIFTGLTRFCLLYRLLGMNTCEVKQ